MSSLSTQRAYAQYLYRSLRALATLNTTIHHLSKTLASHLLSLTSLLKFLKHTIQFTSLSAIASILFTVVMYAPVAVILPLFLHLSTTSPVPESNPSSLLKRSQLVTKTPVAAPALVPGSAQTATLTEMIQSLWDSSGVIKTGVYPGKTTEFPLFGDCNVVVPSAVNDSTPAHPHIYVNVPAPELPDVPSATFNVYMKTDPQYPWRSAQDCRDACMETVLNAVKAGEPSVECQMWVGPPAGGNPGNSECIAGYAEATAIGKSESAICGS